MENILTDEGYADLYCETLKYLVDNRASYDDFNNWTLKAGDQTENITKHKCEGWFHFNGETITPLPEQINELLNSLNKKPKDITQHIADNMKSELRKLKIYINDMTSLAKSIWYSDSSFRIHDTIMNPRVAWECIDILKGREKAHNKKTKNMDMKKEDVTMYDNNKENTGVICLHFQ